MGACAWGIKIPAGLILCLALAACSGNAPGLGDDLSPETGTECYPSCRDGFVCYKGACVSACNPACPDGTICQSAGANSWKCVAAPDDSGQLPEDAENQLPDEQSSDDFADSGEPPDSNQDLAGDVTQSTDPRINPKVVVLAESTALASVFQGGHLIAPMTQVGPAEFAQLYDLSKIAPGSIIVSGGHPDPLQHGMNLRVKEAVQVDGKWDITPDPIKPFAPLAEIIQQGSMHLEPKTVSFSAEVPNAFLVRNAGGAALEPGTQHLCKGDAGIDASVDIGVDFEPQFEFRVDSDWYQVNYIQARLAGSFTAYANANITAFGQGTCGSGDEDQEIWKVSHDHVVVVAGVPVLLTLQARLLAGWEIGIEGSAEVSAGASASTTVGIEFEYRDGNFLPPTPTSSFSTERSGPTIELDMGAHAKVWIRAEVKTLVYGIVGPYLGVKPGLDLEVAQDSLNSPYFGWSLDFTNSFYVGCSVEILGATLADWQVDDLLPSTKELARGCVDGPCCNALAFAAKSLTCDPAAATSYRCGSTECGGTVQKRVDAQKCSGDKAGCSGSLEQGTWVLHKTCEAGEICKGSGVSFDCSPDATCQPSCPDCPNCSDHGSCLNGKCDCAEGFSGGCCTECATGYLGDWPNCVKDPCSPDPCNGHGTCNSGSCACSSGWDGEHCEIACTPNASAKCFNGDVYSYDSCGIRHELLDDCTSTEKCVESDLSAACQAIPVECKSCSTSTDCGTGYTCQEWAQDPTPKMCYKRCSTDQDCAAPQKCFSGAFCASFQYYCDPWGDSCRRDGCGAETGCIICQNCQSAGAASCW